MRPDIVSTHVPPVSSRRPQAAIVAIAPAVVALAATGLAGCGFSKPPEFRLNFEGRDPEKISLTQVDAITEALRDWFGTPDEPAVPKGVGLDLGLLQMAAGPLGRLHDRANGRVQSDSPGPVRGLYRQHCAACHGISGDGAGPLARILDPYPRDFRNGVFKYTSTLPGAKPTREDLQRTLAAGIPATAMPSFAELDPLHIAALVEYVKYLSIRGQTELYLIQLVVDEDEPLPLGADATELVMGEGVLAAAESWELPEREPNVYVVTPPPMPAWDAPGELAESIARGRELFASRVAQCVKCHGPAGAGDGEETELYDDWNKPKKGVTPEETKRLARLFTLPIRRLRARNFHEGVFHGGSRPIDLYRRIHIGIKGTPMPAGGPMPGVAGPLAPEEIWDVVNYVRSLGKKSAGKEGGPE